MTGLSKVATALVALTLGAGGAYAQISGGTSGSVGGDGMSAGTYGSGTTDDSSLGVSGGGAATAEGGTTSTRSDAKLNERRAMQRSTADARTDDARARSRTRTVVRRGDEVRSRTHSMYHEKGGKPVIENTWSRSTPDGTVTKQSGTPK